MNYFTSITITSIVILTILSSTEGIRDKGCTRVISKTVTKYVNVPVLRNRTISAMCDDKKCIKIVKKTVTEKKIKTSTIPVRVCCEGYKLVNKVCKPVCTYGCENGFCSGPNNCTCLTGYKKQTDARCVPDCGDLCGSHGLCVAKGFCQCYSNYEKHVNGSCIPLCINKCINSDCTRPDICTCHPGYIQNTNKSNECNPVCSNPCHFGECIAPDICKCNDGYKLNSTTNHCQPVCDLCENGICESPGKCVCPTGFKATQIQVDSNKGVKCEPICEAECIHGNCSAPNMCECHQGYVMEHGSINICSPVCEPLCGSNGICVEPNICVESPTESTTKLYDYTTTTIALPTTLIEKDILTTSILLMTTQTNEEEISTLMETTPISDKDTPTTPTILSILTALTVPIEQTTIITTTENYESYEEDTTQIDPDPICTKPCVNGDCIETDTCHCWQGYSQSYSDSNKCTPVCDNDDEFDICGNGTCIAPSVCKCLDGYVMSVERNNACISCEDCLKFNFNCSINCNTIKEESRNDEEPEFGLTNYIYVAVILISILSLLIIFVIKFIRNNKKNGKQNSPEETPMNLPSVYYVDGPKFKHEYKD